ncbi:MAG: ExeA family protein [Acidimicrobiia bacterium]
MYLQHFGLTRYPFPKTIPPEELFLSTAAHELQARLEHWLELRSIALVTGEPGSGKSTLCRRFAASLHPGLYRLFYVCHSTGNPTDLYKLISWELRLPVERNRVALYRSIQAEITRLITEKKTLPVLMIDEAHNLRSDVLEDLRLLTNFAMDSENRFALLLIGQSELRRRLSLSVHEAFSQRTTVRQHLAGLSRDEIEPYLLHLLHLAGTELPLFEPEALETLYQATQGLPRKLNLYAHHALIAAALAKSKTVSSDHVGHAMEEVGR